MAAWLAPLLSGDAKGWVYLASVTCALLTWGLVITAWVSHTAPALQRGSEGYAAHGRRRQRIGWLLLALGVLAFFSTCCLPNIVLSLAGPQADSGSLLIGAILTGVSASGGGGLLALIWGEPSGVSEAGQAPWSRSFRRVPNARIEVDPRGIGRTRLRVGAPSPLPIAGTARLRPQPGQRLGEKVLQAMRWIGPGAEFASRWNVHLREGLNVAGAVADERRLAATLSPHGLLVQLPGLVPGREALSELQRAAEILSAGLAAEAAEPPPEGISFVALADLNGLCACCWEELNPEDAQVNCEHCRAAQHADCFEWTGGCGRFACAGAAETDDAGGAGR